MGAARDAARKIASPLRLQTAAARAAVRPRSSGSVSPQITGGRGLPAYIGLGRAGAGESAWEGAGESLYPRIASDGEPAGRHRSGVFCVLDGSGGRSRFHAVNVSGDGSRFHVVDAPPIGFCSALLTDLGG